MGEPVEQIGIRYAGRFGEFELDVDVCIPAVGVTGIFGPSGAGKTTLLRCIAGLASTEQASLIVQDEDWESSSTGRMPAHERPIAYVFQDGRLFPHLSVRENLEYGAKRVQPPTPWERIVEVVARDLEIDALLDRSVTSLSGGEAQRVAIGRAVLYDPSIMLMDEPLASVDVERRNDILRFIERISEDQNSPYVYVSHNIDEICRIADYLVIVDKGNVIASGDPQDVLVRADLPVISDEQAGSVIRARPVGYDERVGLTRATFSGGDLMLAGRQTCDAHRSLRVRVRANDVSLCLTRPTDSSILNILPAVIENIAGDDSASVLVRLRVGEDRLLARVTRKSIDALRLREGIEVYAQIKSVAVR